MGSRLESVVKPGSSSFKMPSAKAAAKKKTDAKAKKALGVKKTTKTKAPSKAKARLQRRWLPKNPKRPKFLEPSQNLPPKRRSPREERRNEDIIMISNFSVNLPHATQRLSQVQNYCINYKVNKY